MAPDTTPNAPPLTETPLTPAAARRRLGLPKLILFALIVLLFMLAAVELGLRLAGFEYVPPSDFALFTHSNDIFGRCITFDPDTLYGLKPGAEIDFYGHAYQINSQGWRSPEFSPRRPPKARRIIAIGDSNVLGYRLPLDQTFTAILGRLAGEKAAREGRPWSVEAINCGVLGWSSFQVRQALEQRVFAYEPVALIVYTGAWNEGLWAARTDREQWGMINTLNPRSLLYQSRMVQLMRMPVAQRYRRENLDALLDIIAASNAGQINPSWRRRVSFEEFGEDVAWIERECRQRDIPVIFLSPILRPSMEAAREPLGQYRARLGALQPTPPGGILDLADLTKDMPEDEVFLENDPVHLRPEIHELIAKEIFKRLTPAINGWDRAKE